MHACSARCAGEALTVVALTVLCSQGLHRPMTYTAAGWGGDRFGPGVYGWAGAGGSLFVWVPHLRLSFAYVPNLAASRLSKPRGERLLQAAVEAAKAHIAAAAPTSAPSPSAVEAGEQVAPVDAVDRRSAAAESGGEL